MQQKSEYKIDCRTNKDEIISRVLAISALNRQIKVHFGDAVDLIHSRRNRTRDVLYVDPPYYVQGESLYRYFYRLKDHKRLAEALTTTKANWLASYDDHHVIEFLYEQFTIKRHAFKYSARKPKSHNELLIANFDLPSNLDGWNSAR
jgi:DNA adenine methylase